MTIGDVWFSQNHTEHILKPSEAGGLKHLTGLYPGIEEIRLKRL